MCDMENNTVIYNFNEKGSISRYNLKIDIFSTGRFEIQTSSTLTCKKKKAQFLCRSHSHIATGRKGDFQEKISKLANSGEIGDSLVWRTDFNLNNMLYCLKRTQPQCLANKLCTACKGDVLHTAEQSSLAACYQQNNKTFISSDLYQDSCLYFRYIAF